ncbi:MAG: glycoside hydrolase family 57 protein [Candidatus Zixiibacteriota bacterium]
MGKYKYSSGNSKIYVAILWHMHQPWYSEAGSSKCIMPWVRLHALKDYYDMPDWVEKVPGMKATFNLVPSLLKQIQGYADGELTDKYQDLFMMHPGDMTKKGREFVVKNFFAANHENFVATSPRYNFLSKKRNQGAQAFTDQEIIDLQMHFEMAWFGQSMKKSKAIKKFLRKDIGFDHKDKQVIIEMEKERLSSIIPKYRQIAQNEDIELTTTPFYHPILPILCDFENIKAADTSSPMPDARFSYPEDAKAQIEKGLEYFEQSIGQKPMGMWPSEGSVAEDIIPLMIDAGVKWIATDEEILWKSMGGTKKIDSLFVPYYREIGDKKLALFFRDHKLSDKIGFEYSNWKADEAVQDFLVNLRGIRDIMPNSPYPYIVPVILDGENAWEYFRDNGEKFLTSLYNELVDADDIEPITFSGFMDMQPDFRRLKYLAAGSWISGNFRTWSGDPEKNRGWELVAKTRDILEKSDLDSQKKEKAFEHMMIAEGSDWFWWYGEGNYTPYLDQFDRLFRSHLRAAIKDCKDNEFPELDEVVFEKEPVIDFQKQPVSLITPIIDGKETSFYEWSPAGSYKPTSFRGTMHGEGSKTISKLHIGFNLQNLYMRMDGKKNIREEVYTNDFDIALKFQKPQEKTILIKNDYTIELYLKGKRIQRKIEPIAEIRDIIEISIPFVFLGAKEKSQIIFTIEIYRKDVLLETIPIGGVFAIDVPDESYKLDMWHV